MNSGGGGWQTGTLVNMPTTCSVGAGYFASDQPAEEQLYTCSAANTWTPYIQVGGYGALAITNGQLDIVSAVVPTKGNPNMFTGLNEFVPGITLDEQSSAGTPASGKDNFYVNNTDHLLHMVNSSGADTPVGSSGGSLFYQTVQSNGTSEAQRTQLNFIPGTNTSVTVAHNSGNNSTDITVAVPTIPFGDVNEGIANDIPYFNASGVLTQGCTGFDGLHFEINYRCQIATPADALDVSDPSGGNNNAYVRIEDGNSAGKNAGLLLAAYGMNEMDWLLQGVGATNPGNLSLDDNYSSADHWLMTFQHSSGNVYIGGTQTDRNGTGAELTVTSSTVQLNPVVSSALPACGSSIEGSLAAIKDSTANTFGATITGGGTYHVKG